MKKSVLVLLILFSGHFQFIKAQNSILFVNFDEVQLAFSPFSGAVFNVVPNPGIDTFNPSANVGKVVSTTASTYEGIMNVTPLAKPLDFTTNPVFKLKVFSPKAGATVGIKLQISTSRDYYSVNTTTTKANEWETLSFNVAAAKNNYFDQIVLFFDLSGTGNGENWYFDDLMLVSNPASVALLPPYEVGIWKGFKNAAITYTFDDNYPNQLSKIVPMADGYGFKLTLFTIVNQSANWKRLAEVALKGHEVASHTITHTSLSGLTDAQQTIDYQGSQDTINKRITTQKCQTIAYPNCITGNKTLCSSYYIAARGCQGTVESSTPADFMKISSIACGSGGVLNSLVDFNAQADNASKAKGWCVYLMHGISNEAGYPIDSTIVRGSFNYMNSNKNLFWVENFVNVVKYIKERNSLTLSLISSKVDTIKLNLTSTQNQLIYNVPVSIRRPLPAGWVDAKVYQNNVLIASAITNVDGVKFLNFDVVPNGGEVKLTNNLTNALPKSIADATSCSIFPNPFTDILVVKTSNPVKSLSIYDVSGKELSVYHSNNEFENQLDTKNLQQGIYFLIIKDVNGKEFNKKIIKL